jgi:hypothetical protein
MTLGQLRADLQANKHSAVDFVADRLGSRWLRPDGVANLQREIEAAYNDWLAFGETETAQGQSVRTLHDFFVERYQIESGFLALGADLPD